MLEELKLRGDGASIVDRNSTHESSTGEGVQRPWPRLNPS